MPKSSDRPDTAPPQRTPGFRDPARSRGVWIVFFLLLAGMVPVWPIEGAWFGVPAWAAFALLVSTAASLFIAWVSLYFWRDGEEDGEAPPDAD